MVKKNKCRGYLFEKKGYIRFHCHNCEADLKFDDFLKDVNSFVYQQYKDEKIKEWKFNNKSRKKYDDTEYQPRKINSSEQFKALNTLDKLPSNHPAKQLVIARKIPQKFWNKLFYTPEFKTWVNTIIPNKFENVTFDEERIVIPFYYHDKLIAFQGRAVNTKNEVRYITIVLDETEPTVFGLDQANLNDPVYCFEGPIDAMFISNSIATAGGDLVNRLGKIDRRNIKIIYDNEPRSKETKLKMLRAIKDGFSVCIWPNNIKDKDVNRMVISGIDPKHIKFIIDKNLHSGYSGELLIKQWSKA